MTIDPRLIEQLIELVPIAAGAGIALAGGGIKYWIDQRNRRRQVRRERLERLLHVAFELKAWSDHVDDRYIFGTRQDRISDPMEELAVLSTLYFQDLEAEVSSVSMAAMNYKKAAQVLAQERLKAGGAVPSDATDRMSAPYEQLLTAIGHLREKAKSLAKEIS